MDAGLVEAEVIRQNWRVGVVAGYEGYVTPAVGCGIVAFNSRDEVLMIQRPSRKWWFPTGFCDVGNSAAETIVKEASEETGYLVDPLKLMESRKTGDRVAPPLCDSFLLSGRRRRTESASIGGDKSGVLPARRFAAAAAWQRPQMDSARARVHFEGRVEPYFDRV